MLLRSVQGMRFHIKDLSLADNGRYKINVDGATSHSVFAAAAVIRNSIGAIIAYQTWFSAQPLSSGLSIEADIRAFFVGFEVVVLLHLSGFQIEGDTSLVVDFINGKDSAIPWQIRPLALDCKYLKVNNNEAIVQHVRADANSVEHSLARSSLSCGVSRLWVSDFPLFVIEAAEADMPQTDVDLSSA
ncbi:hypothetical protein BVC80_8063g4 [Macleaya cordata]|uniref:RNase H type-1 domain-containing protein n=1 Tax=Macleaya cordata TaxID=56857 RepID=A0A200Q046_MACCD|nr:hypothetical protein BVC80_8063g4 [Macleaya cordata]